MGVDYLNCETCSDCKNSELFFQCQLCYEHLENCNLCYDKQKNNFAESKNIFSDGLIICDNCIEFYNDIEELQDINFKEYKINKKKLHKALKKSRIKYFSHKVKISKIFEKIIMHEKAIDGLKLQLKELQL